jgi:hypothetical protein
MREDWKIDYILERITSNTKEPVRLGIVPDIPRFDALAFEFYAAFIKKPVTVNRLWTMSEPFILGNDYILLSETDQGFAKFFAPEVHEVNQYILSRPDSFHFVESFTLPSGQIIRLYRVS